MKNHYDVIVIGGGPSGALAAWASARYGAKTLLIDEGSYLGGMLTKAGVGPQMSYHAGTRQVVCGLAELLVKKMVENGYSPGHMPDYIGFAPSITPFDPEGLKLVWEDSLLRDGVEILYYAKFIGCRMNGSKIKDIQVLTRSGIETFEAKVFIDCCGGELASKTPCRVLYGRSSDGLTQPMTMKFRVSGVNRNELIEFIQSNPQDMYVNTKFGDLNILPRVGMSGAYSTIRQAKAVGDFKIDRDTVLLFETNQLGEFIVNMSRVTHSKSTSSSDMTKAEIIGRKQVHEIYRFLKKYIPGFSASYIVNSGPFIGVREGFRIEAMYQITAEDLLQNKIFADVIACGGYPIDIHSPDGEEMEYKALKPGSWYQIPYRSLITREVENMIVAGRSLGAEHEALSAIRVSPILEAVGQAAGTAAAIAADSSSNNVQTTSVSKVQQVLDREGAFLESYVDKPD